jgi:hypothetical protein
VTGMREGTPWLTRLLVTLVNGDRLTSHLPIAISEDELLANLREGRPLIVRGDDGGRTIVPATAVLHIRQAAD